MTSFRKISFLVAVFLLSFGFVVWSSQISNAQTRPLNLAQILTFLNSQIGTVAEKNAYLEKAVKEQGVDFNLKILLLIQY